MYVLWLRFLTEINESTVNAPKELAEQPQISKAMSIVEKSAYTDEQLDGYDRYRDIIWRERTLVSESHREGFEEGKAEGVEEGIGIGIEKGIGIGIEKGKTEAAKMMLASGMSKMQVATILHMNIREVETLIE